MIEEQFDQKVNMAIGSTLSDFNINNETSLVMQELQGCGDENLRYLPFDQNMFSNEAQVELEESLSSYMGSYGIDEKYNVEILSGTCVPAKGAYCCSIGGNDEYMLGVSFLARKEYTHDQLVPMVLASILIFLLLASVSFLILWSLVKQKRITENNIDFFNNTAHELKTPLTNISLALKLLGNKYSVVQEDKYAKIIKSENTKLSNQIERVLFLSKMENGEYALKKESLDIGQVLKEVTDNMKLLADEREAIISLDLPKNKTTILGDYYHISNVFRNLIDNALKYCDKNPVINISVQEEQNQIIVVFKDNGIGISAQDQSHIFEKFQRVNTGNIRRAKGFGIGLSYVKTVIEMHKGLVRVESELNKGSTFQLLIPNA